MASTTVGSVTMRSGKKARTLPGRPRAKGIVLSARCRFIQEAKRLSKP